MGIFSNRHSERARRAKNLSIIIILISSFISFGISFAGEPKRGFVRALLEEMFGAAGGASRYQTVVKMKKISYGDFLNRSINNLTKEGARFEGVSPELIASLRDQMKTPKMTRKFIDELCLSGELHSDWAKIVSLDWASAIEIARAIPPAGSLHAIAASEEGFNHLRWYFIEKIEITFAELYHIFLTSGNLNPELEWILGQLGNVLEQRGKRSFFLFGEAPSHEMRIVENVAILLHRQIEGHRVQFSLGNVAPYFKRLNELYSYFSKYGLTLRSGGASFEILGMLNLSHDFLLAEIQFGKEGVKKGALASLLQSYKELAAESKKPFQMPMTMIRDLLSNPDPTFRLYVIDSYYEAIGSCDRSLRNALDALCNSSSRSSPGEKIFEEALDAISLLLSYPQETGRCLMNIMMSGKSGSSEVIASMRGLALVCSNPVNALSYLYRIDSFQQRLLRDADFLAAYVGEVTGHIHLAQSSKEAVGAFGMLAELHNRVEGKELKRIVMNKMVEVLKDSP